MTYYDKRYEIHSLNYMENIMSQTSIFETLQPSLKLIKITYQEAGVSVRGLFVMNGEEKKAFYLMLQDYFNIQEALILSTCNRTEIYYVHQDNLNESILKLLGSCKGLSSQCFEYYFSSFATSSDVLKHLFRVGCGLESNVLGDLQILGQVKQAYQEAVDIGMAHTLIHRLMHVLFFTHKRICQETAFKAGATSIPYCAVKLIRDQDLGDLESPILVIGAGKMGTDVCRNLVDLGYKNLTVTNRSPEKSEALGKELNVHTLLYSLISEKLDQFDILISTISSSQPLLFQKEGKAVHGKKFFCLDLSAPKSFSQGFVNSFADRYFDIDHIGAFACQTINRRQAEISKVEAIIEQSLHDFNEWLNEHQSTRKIIAFKNILDQLRKESIAQYIKKLDSQQFELIDEISKCIIQRIIKHSVVQMKQTCRKDNTDKLEETIIQLFDLEYNHFKTKNNNRL